MNQKGGRNLKKHTPRAQMTCLASFGPGCRPLPLPPPEPPDAWKLLVRIYKTYELKKTYLRLKRHHLVSFEPVVGVDEARVMDVTTVTVVMVTHR